MNLSHLKSNDYIRAIGIRYDGILPTIKKSSDSFQALWEAVTNSLESLLEGSNPSSGKLIIRFFLRANPLLPEQQEFECLEVEDNGAGFNDTNFERFIQLKDNRKGPQNRGSGRIQLLHTFQKTEYISTYEQQGQFFTRSFILSSQPEFKKNNALIYYKNTVPAEKTAPSTLVRCSGISPKDSPTYTLQSAEKFKNHLKTHYLSLFCSIRESMPTIRVELYRNNQLQETTILTAADIPEEHSNFTFNLQRARYNAEKKQISHTDLQEKFSVRCFRVPEKNIRENRISLVSKNETLDQIRLDFDFLKNNDSINGNRYLLFVSGDYLDNLPGDTRGELLLPSEKDLRTNNSLFSWNESYILQEDLRKQTNSSFKAQYPEIQKQEEKYLTKLQDLEKMFLLNKEELNDFQNRFGLNISTEDVLKHFYENDSRKAAKNDARLKNIIDELATLNPAQNDYQECLMKKVEELARIVPMQNRANLTRYVARRDLVLEIFDQALHRELTLQKTPGRNINEKLLHNILFKQSSDNPEQSDLWLINEDFIYFQGCSEKKLREITINGEYIFRDDFSAVEEDYLHSGGKDRTSHRPDVLLFPEEGKCIILEFKNPDVDVSNYLTQINKYASWLGQYTKDEYDFSTFYGYLIGEFIEKDDIMAADADFQEAYQFHYFFKPSQNIYRGAEKEKGTLYTEIIKYSVLLERARKRNKIFIDKLLAPQRS